MSRVIVKNLPKKITEDGLKNHFGPEIFNDITDTKLKYDINGNFRGFAFIGFKSPDTASKVITSYDKSYITNTRIKVETYDESAKPVKTKYSDEAYEVQKLNLKTNVRNEKTKKTDVFDEFKDDPEFQQFIKVQRNLEQKGTKDNYIWSDNVRNENDPELAIPVPPTESSEVNDQTEKRSKKGKKKKNVDEKKVEKSQDDQFCLKLGKLPYKAKKRLIKEFFKPLEPTKVTIPSNIHGIAYVSFSSIDEMQKALLKHKSFLDGKQIDVKVNSDKSRKTSETPTKDEKTKKTYKEPTESIADTSRLYVRNLSYTCTPEDLEDLFKTYGELTEVYLPIDPSTKKPKGFAFIAFMFPEHAIKALEGLDKTIFQGRLLHIIPGESKPNTVKQFNQLSSFKQQKQIEALKESENPNAWNILFLGANATAEVMSSKFDVTKTQLLADTTSKDSVAVRMALGETQIVNETKKFLEDSGINLDAFSDNQSTDKKPKRSKTVIIVKNLPAKTKPEEIEELFKRYGSVNRVILPSYGVTAVVEMQEVSEARKAFQKMSVFKFKHSPLYLEWAPLNVFVSGEDQPSAIKATDPETEKPIEDNEHTGEEGCTLFVKNLNFNTKDEDFLKHFSKCGSVKSAKVSRRKNGSSGSETLLSMGFGFVVYEQKKSAEKAIRELQNSILDGHRLHVARSRSGSCKPLVASGDHQGSSVSSGETKLTQDEQDTTSKKSKKSNKILVKNIPFEATFQEVQELFRAFGGLKSVRLPKRLVGTGTHRGFGFVEFNTSHEAEKSMEALSGSTHLYGRRLVLEWAEPSVNDEDRKRGINCQDSVSDPGAAIPRQKASLSGSKSKKLKKSDLVSRLEVSDLPME